MSHLYCHWQVFVDETFLLGFHEKLFWVTEKNSTFSEISDDCMPYGDRQCAHITSPESKRYVPN